MSLDIRCHCCDDRFGPDGFAPMLRTRRLCPRYRGPLPAPGRVPSMDCGRGFLCLPVAP